MAVDDAYVFPGFLTPVLTQLFFPKLPTTFLTCFCRGERRNFAGKKSRLNRGSNSQPQGHESNTLTTEPSGRGERGMTIINLLKEYWPSWGSNQRPPVFKSTMLLTELWGWAPNGWNEPQRD